jgi:hypothetical protein
MLILSKKKKKTLQFYNSTWMWIQGKIQDTSQKSRFMFIWINPFFIKKLKKYYLDGNFYFYFVKKINKLIVKFLADEVGVDWVIMSPNQLRFLFFCIFFNQEGQGLESFASWVKSSGCARLWNTS